MPQFLGPPSLNTVGQRNNDFLWAKNMELSGERLGCTWNTGQKRVVQPATATATKLAQKTMPNH